MLDSTFSENLADIIKYHRQKSGLTQEALARLASVGKTVVFEVEHGKKTVRLENLIKILTVLNISMTLQSPLMQAYEETHREKR